MSTSAHTTRVRFFGALTVEVADHAPITLHGTRRQALLGYLVCNAGRRILRDDIAAMFWPELDHAAALRALRNIVYRLKADLTAIGVPEQLIAQDYSSLLIRSDLISADYLDFSEAAVQVQQHDHDSTGLCAPCLAAFNRMLDLYAGELLPGPFTPIGSGFQDWLVSLRQHCERLALQAAAVLTERSLARADYADAGQRALRWLAIEPWNEVAFRRLMEALARSGDRNGALAAFRRCRTAVRREFATEPEIATFNLYNRIRAGRLESAAPPARTAQHIQRSALQQRIIRQLEQPSCRLLTVVGLAGSGKSVLAEMIAQRLTHHLDGQAVFVQLAGSFDSGRAAAALCMSLGLDLSRETDPLALLRKELCNGRRLLVLDQFDRFADAAQLLQNLTSWPDGPKVLVTSRAPFGLADEWRQPIDGLECAAADWDGSGPWPESVQLMVETIRRQSQDFCPSREHLQQLNQLAHSVDGLPLALVLLAQQSTYEPGTPMPRRPRRTAPAAESADDRVTRIIGSSWLLLSPAEQQLLATLALLQSSFTMETAHALTAELADDRIPLETRLYDFVDRGLLRIATGRRFSFHALVHEFARHRLDLLPSAAAVRQAYAALFGQRMLDIAGRLERITSVSSDSWQIELPDFVEALRIAAGLQTPAMTARLISAFVRILIIAGRSDLGLTVLAELRSVFSSIHSADHHHGQLLLAVAWLEEARLAYYSTDVPHGLHCCHSARVIAEQLAEPALLLRSAVELTRLMLVTYDFNAAARYVQQIEQLRTLPALDPLLLSLADRVQLQFYAETSNFTAARAAAERLLGPESRGDREMRATAILINVMLHWSLGDYRAAIQLLCRFLSVAETQAAVGRDWTFCVIERLNAGTAAVFDPLECTTVRYHRISKATSIVSHFIALLLDRLGLQQAADAAYADALQVSYAGGGPWSRRGILCYRAANALRRGLISEARALARESMQLCLAIGDRRFAAAAECALARSFLADQPDTAAAHFTAALHQLRTVGVEYLCAEPLAGLAEVALLRGDTQQALHCSEQILNLSWPFFWQVDDPVAVMVTVVRALRAAAAPGWPTIVEETVRRIQHLAASLPDGECAAAFRAIPSHRSMAEFHHELSACLVPLR